LKAGTNPHAKASHGKWMWLNPSKEVEVGPFGPTSVNVSQATPMARRDQVATSCLALYW
jgi:hypothetical protein